MRYRESVRETISSALNSPLLRLILILGPLLIWMSAEYLSPLRAQTQSKGRRWLRNFSLALISGGILRLTLLPVLMRFTEIVQANGWGGLAYLRNHFSWSVPLLGVSAFLVQDLVLYYWHRANHLIPLLWRFHQVHHVDLDMDVSTASRFHAGELMLSAAFQLIAVLIIGVSPFQLLLYQTVLILATQFHHSNLRLPEWLDRGLQAVIITPRIHEVHHSIVQRETDSNWGTVFSFWDRIHRTFHGALTKRNEIAIGVASYRDPAELGLPRILIMPFQRLRAWRLPNGRVPKRDVDGILRI